MSAFLCTRACNSKRLRYIVQIWSDDFNRVRVGPPNPGPPHRLPSSPPPPPPGSAREAREPSLSGGHDAVGGLRREGRPLRARKPGRSSTRIVCLIWSALGPNWWRNPGKAERKKRPKYISHYNAVCFICGRLQQQPSRDFLVGALPHAHLRCHGSASCVT